MKYPGKILPEVLRIARQKPVTVKYPFERTEIPADFRGKIAFDASKCVGCKMCMKDCPAHALEIIKPGEEKIFECLFHLDRCIFCAQCVQSCPRHALSSTPQFELANYQRDQLEDHQK
jgi:formate hydrogenlyase subunit 6/NADH:ubiquinone oxidoreductase subunit I